MAEKTVEQKKAAAVLFQEIAEIAAELVDELTNTPFPHDDPDSAYQTEVRVQAAIKRIGFIADLGSSRCGGTVTLGGANDWLLSPVARDAVNAAA